MRFDIITIFPETLEAIFGDSILARAQDSGRIEIHVHNLRNWTEDKRNTIDDKPFGGGPGMLMMVEPIYRALKELGVYPSRPQDTKVFLMSAQGAAWSQPQALAAATDLKRIVIIAGHYEGVDHRVTEHLIDAEISIGNYVLTGGELPAAIIVDSIARLIPGVLGNPDSLAAESHDPGIDAEYPQYTRPAEFVTDEGDSWQVPEILTSGNHAEIAKWQEAHTQKPPA